ncbi:ABC transporter ATP-binding protein [Helicobacter sp. MIT 99-10781]|uniref:ABC transporter ATP-binding protein n=1 Tax=Helicobacter sp. MIT 99-10781 TaxID=1332285 RepID=UPI000E20A6A8|nr:ABC transporter ATP-binding protein [Helicobacter sp. MIT 99-10781]RDU54031.1 ABC transporter ATP-binding protein [Helicobacter sp. MIT 99-10781]
MWQMLQEITLGNVRHFYKSLFWSSVSEMVNFAGIFIVFVFCAKFLAPYLGGSAPSIFELWVICAIGFVYMAISFLVAIPAYKNNYVSAYEQSASGRLNLAEHIRRLPLGFLERSNPARLSHSLMKDFSNLETANSHLLPQMFGALVVSFVVFIALVCYHWQMALSFFLCVPLAFIILVCVRKLAKYLSDKHLSAILNASNHLNEYIDGIATIKAHNMAGEKFARLEKAFENLRKESIRIEVGLMPFALAVLSCMGAGVGIMVLVGREFLLNGDLSVIEYLGFILIGSKAFVPLLTFSINFLELQYFSRSEKNIRELLGEPQMSGSDTQIPKGNEIVLKNISFGYEKDAPVLKNISLAIPERSSVAIVGKSGSGKSTLVKLIARFYDMDRGVIEIGDAKNGYKNIASLEPEALMKKFSMVFQDVYLFANSVESNVAFGRENADKGEILNALKKASALEFVEALPEGEKTPVGEGGSSLSGGEKQRISIARCIIKDSPIVLLDEITSSLDVYNEFAMQQAINELARDKSVIIIAHKLKSIISCDKIVLLDNGEIKECGTHEELLKQNGFYKKMWEEESKGA